MNNTEGVFNSAFGDGSLAANQSGSYNTVYGAGSIASNSNGYGNTALGESSLGLMTDGNFNTAMGKEALLSNIMGNKNVALGYHAGYYETADNRLYIDNDAHADLADGREKSLIYGIFDADPANQKLTLNANVGINTTTPNSSAALDVSSTTKGFLPPRMNIEQRNAIANPAEGLIVFCTNCSSLGNPIISVYLMGKWLNVSSSYETPSSPTAGTHIPETTQITWNWNISPITLGYKWNTVNDSITATDMGMVTSKIETGLTCETNYTRYVWAYNVCGFSTPVTLTQSTSACIPCGSSITINHVVSGGVAPVAKTVT